MGADGESAQQLQQPLGPPPGPLQYRLLASVIADQLQAIGNADEKGLGATDAAKH